MKLKWGYDDIFKISSISDFSILKLRAWCEEAGGGVEIVYEQKEPKVEATKIDNSNPYWMAFKKAIKDLYVLKL